MEESHRVEFEGIGHVLFLQLDAVYTGALSKSDRLVTCPLQARNVS